MSGTGRALLARLPIKAQPLAARSLSFLRSATRTVVAPSLSLASARAEAIRDVSSVPSSFLAEHGCILSRSCVRAAPLSLCLALSACASTHKEAVELDATAQQETESHATESLEIHRREEPSRVTTTVEEYGPPEEMLAEGRGALGTAYPPSAAVGQHDLPDSNRATLGIPVVLPFHGPLIKLTTTVEERGTVSEDTSASAAVRAVGAQREALSGKGESESTSKPSLGLPVLGLLLAGIAVAAILMRGVWIGPALSLIKRLLGRAV